MARLDDSFLYQDSQDTLPDTRLDDSFLYDEEKPEEKSVISTVADSVISTVDAIPKYVYGFFEGGGAAIENRQDIANKINASLESAQIGAASALSQLGKAGNKFFGYEGKDALTDALNNYVKDNSTRVSGRLDKAIKGLQDSQAKQVISKEGEFFREAGTAAIESAGSMLAGGALKSVGAGIGAMAPQVFGQQYDILKKEGEDEQGAVLHAAGKTVIELLSEILPLKKIIDLPDGIARKIADMTLIEGGTEAASSIGDSLYDANIRDKDLDWDVEFDKAVESFKLGAAAGGMTGAVVSTPQIAAKVGGAVIGTAQDTLKKGSEALKSFGEAPAETDQSNQPSELFTPTHKTSDGADLQVATKDGKILPDTYVNQQGSVIRDETVTSNDPSQVIDVSSDINAVVAGIKSEIFGKQGATDGSSGISKADNVIASLEEGNQKAIDSEFSALSPEIGNQDIIDNQNFEKTISELNQTEIDSQSEVSPVAGQSGLPPEIPVTQDEAAITPRNDPVFPRNINAGPMAAKVTPIGKKGTKLYRETSIDGLASQLMTNRRGDVDNIFVTDDKVLAISQGEKSDVMIEFKGDFLSGVENRKPGTGVIGGKEFIANFVSKGAISKITVKGDRRTSDGLSRRLLNQDFTKNILSNGDAEYTPTIILKNKTDDKIAEKTIGETTKNIESIANEAATSIKNELPLPSDAQKESGNYKKAHVKVQGLDITIENPKGSNREGIDSNGKRWSVKMPSSYGYIKGTVGADSEKGAARNKIEQLDTYIGNNPESQEVFIVNQQDPITGKFDELKVIVGSNNVNDAMSIYFGGFSDGTGGSRAKSVYQVPMAEFKELLTKGLGTNEIKNTDGPVNISQSFIDKLAVNNGADKLVKDKSKKIAFKSKADKLNPNNPDVSRGTKSKKIIIKPSKQKVIKNERKNAIQNKPLRKETETQNEAEKKTKRDNRVSNDIQKQPSNDVSNPYRAMKGKEISYQVDVKDSGETFTVTVYSETVIRDIDIRIKALQELKDCI